MTVVVETPAGEKTGSSTREIKRKGGLALTPQMRPTYKVKGQAVIIDLGEQGLLFALLAGSFEYEKLFKTFPGRWKLGTRKLDPELYPRFVRFKNLDDPRTIQRIAEPDGLLRVKKAFPNANVITFEEAYGKDFKIKEITLEMTNAPPDLDIVKKIPWLESRLDVGGTLGGAVGSGEDPSGLFIQGGDFLRRRN